MINPKIKIKNLNITINVPSKGDLNQFDKDVIESIVQESLDRLQKLIVDAAKISL